MNMHLAKGFWLSILLISFPLAHAKDDIYFKRDKSGHVLFSDRAPFYHAEPVELNQLQTYFAPSSASDTATEENKPSEPESAVLNYQLTITSPQSEQTIRANNGNVTVSVSVTPELKEGHLIVVMDNGAPIGEPSQQTSFQLTDIPRGKHTITAQIINDEGVLASAESVFYVQRRSVILNP